MSFYRTKTDHPSSFQCKPGDENIKSDYFQIFTKASFLSKQKAFMFGVCTFNKNSYHLKIKSRASICCKCESFCLSSCWFQPRKGKKRVLKRKWFEIKNYFMKKKKTEICKQKKVNWFDKFCLMENDWGFKGTFSNWLVIKQLLTLISLMFNWMMIFCQLSSAYLYFCLQYFRLFYKIVIASIKIIALFSRC